MVHTTIGQLHFSTLSWLMLLILPLSAMSMTPENVVVPSCSPEATVCKFHFKVDYNITMMKWQMALDTGEPDTMVPIIVNADGNLVSKKKDCSGEDPLENSDFETLLSGDGSHKRILAVNRRFPGTPMVVYKGQTVSLQVTNEMENEVITLHMHGMHQKGTPWMDGAGSISQCPITPRQTFEYRFVADKVGSHWYHGHIRMQRTMGMMGRLTVLDRTPDEENKRRGDDPIPPIEKQFHMTFTEWIQEATSEATKRLQIGILLNCSTIRFTNGYSTDTCEFPTKIADGSDAYWIPYDSVVINGKTHRYNKVTGKSETPTLPLEIFTVRSGGKFRFRSLNAGIHMSFSVSIDDHLLHVVTADGSDIKTTTVDHLVVHGGERFDFWIEANDPKSVGNYWIRVETLEYSDSNYQKLKVRGKALAILRYEGAAQSIPNTRTHDCSQKTCTYLNCPFKLFPQVDHIQCIPVVDLRTPMPEPTLTPSDGTGFTEFFVAADIDSQSMFNGRQHIPYAAPPQIYPKHKRDIICSDELCEKEGPCECTHEVAVKKGDIVQLVFFSHKADFPPTHSNHPFHLHGNAFQVVKMGWPIYNLNSALIMGNTPDITCEGNETLCKRPRWSDPSWSGGNVPDIIKEGAILKDTVIVPTGGYVVVRFKADNPGYWMMHCHMDMHSELGMTMVFKVGEDSEMPPVPKGFPVCGDFDWSSEEFLERINNPCPQNQSLHTKEAADGEICSLSISGDENAFQVAFIVLGLVVSIGTLGLFINGWRRWNARRRRQAAGRGLMEEVRWEDNTETPIVETTPLLS